MKRREFLKSGALAGTALPFLNACGKKRSQKKKMMVLGIDGLDPAIVNRLMQEGSLPHMQKLAARGAFTMMRSSIPPQSPVAWASFITGADAGVHGIFDFVHRDPKTYLPKFSLSENMEPRWILKLGKYRLPLKPGKAILQREGKPFWDYLEEREVGATIFKVPSNFPPSPTRQRTLSGMGTPDLLGGYGVYTLYTTDEIEFQKDLRPHHVYYADIDADGKMKESQLEGPVNTLLKEREVVSVPFIVYVDDANRTIRIDIQGREILLAEKEYSDWVEVDFPLISGIQSLRGMVKFYLLEMGKRFRLYISPIQIDPRDPVLPISTPSGYCQELAARCGPFHTLGLPADFNAIKTGTFAIENYIVQSQSIFDESEKLFKSELARFLGNDEGLLFFYFSSLDQGQHIFWALTHPDHPYFQPEENKRFGHITFEYYRRCDRILGEALRQIPPDWAVMVISDHGFAPFNKQVDLNHWLWQKGYLRLRPGESGNSPSLVESAKWDETRAYGLGLNGLYLNLRGREGAGIVADSERRRLLQELQGKLEAIRDPENGERIISRAYIAEDCYSRDHLDRAPDIIVGYNRGYRCGDRSGEGGISPAFISPNKSWWSGDHCIDPLKVPATFIANFPLRIPADREIPHIIDLAPTILDFFGIRAGPAMKGKVLT